MDQSRSAAASAQIRAMPYVANADLPQALRAHLPETAQTLFRKAFNGAWSTYEERPDREELAHRVGWSAVKRRYEKVDDRWVPRRRQ